MDKIKYNDYEDYVQKREGINFLANEKYTIISKDDGKSISRYENEDISDNMRFYIKNVKSKEIYDTLEIAKIVYLRLRKVNIYFKTENL